jgi:WD40 repeat protein
MKYNFLGSGHTDEVRAVSYSPCGAFLLSCSDDATAIIHNCAAPQVIHNL